MNLTARVCTALVSGRITVVRIATWNINSVTTRIDRLLTFLDQSGIDVLCLQELKVPESQFPYAELDAAGYESAVLADGRWNGVAIISRVGLADVVRNLPGQPEWEGVVEPRAIGATCGGIRVWSLYVPNGRSVGDPHYSYKLRWLEALRSTADVEIRAAIPVAFLGDYNIAPTDSDVWDPSAFEGSTHVTQAERAQLAELERTGLVEIRPRALKYDIPFTFWDYRQLAFPKNRGMRIDLVYGSADFARAVTDAYVDRDARKPGKAGSTPPSDHAPIVVDLSV
jgi:exodeoxyribonuclease-3